jgi:G3E family GTPase
VKAGDIPFDRIIIETSGVANPEAVLDILLKHHWLSTRLYLHAMITTVSAVMDEHHFDYFPEVQAQIAWADTIVITQTDLASDRQMEKLQVRLDLLAPAAIRLTAVQGVIDVDNLLLSSKRFRRLNTNEPVELPEHNFCSISLRLEHPIPWDYLQKALDIVTRHVIASN